MTTLIIFAAALVLAENGRTVHGSHGVVNGNTVLKALGLHQKFSDSFKLQRLKGCTHVARRFRVGQVRVKERIHPEDIREKYIIDSRCPDSVLHGGAA